MPINGRSSAKTEKKEDPDSSISSKPTIVNEDASIEREEEKAINPEKVQLGISSKHRIKSLNSSISIKNFTEEVEKEKKGEEKEEQITYHGNEKFTEEEFLDCWDQLAEKISQSGKEGSSMIYSAMKTRLPKLKDNHKIKLEVDNLSQLEEIKQKRTELHDYLREKLKNSSIEIELKVLKNKKEKKAYTQEEKFNKLAEINPALLELKKKLDLDFF